MITVRQLIDSNRVAFREGTLGAFVHSDCRYDYEDGCHCAIGASLAGSDLAAIRTLGLNNQPLGVLIRNGVEFEHPAIFGLAQSLHDAWASGSHIFGEGVEEDGSDFKAFPEIAAFVAEVSGSKVGPAEYATFLDVLDRTFEPKMEVSPFRMGMGDRVHANLVVVG